MTNTSTHDTPEMSAQEIDAQLGEDTSAVSTVATTVDTAHAEGDVLSKEPDLSVSGTDETSSELLWDASDAVSADTEEDLDSEDSLTFSNGVIEKIVAIAMRDVPGVIGMKGGWLDRVQETFGALTPRKGVTVEVTPESAVRVNISVMIQYGAYAPQVFEDVKKTVVKQVTGMTGLEVAGVNLRIEDVLTEEEYAASKRADAEDVPAALPAVAESAHTEAEVSA